MNEISSRVDEGCASTPINGTANGKDQSVNTASVNDTDAVALDAIRPELVSAAVQHGPEAADALQAAVLADDVAYPFLRDAAAKALGLPQRVIEQIRRKFRDARKMAGRKSADVIKKKDEAAAADAAILPIEKRHFLDLDDAERKEEAARKWALCKDLAREPDILARADDLLTTRGVVGEPQIKRAVILTVGVARLSAETVNLIIKGPSASGKNYTLRAALRLLPPSAVLSLTDMSERALIFLPAGALRHRVLCLEEATPIQQDDHSLKALYLRALMSGGRIDYMLPEKDPKSGEMVTRRIEQEGPTGCIVTTTAASLHSENETRAITIETDDTPRQTAEIKLAIVERRRAMAAVTDTAAENAIWHALFRHIEVTGPHIVAIPFLDWIALHSDALSIRMRRDLDQMISLIMASAILHRATRTILPEGEIVAEPQDYANAIGIIGTGVNQAAGRTASRQSAAVWRVVHDLVGQKVDQEELPAVGNQSGGDAKAAAKVAARRGEAMMKARVPLSAAELTKYTGRSPSTAERDIAVAVAGGLIIKDDTHRGKASTYGLGVLRLPRARHGVFPSLDALIATGPKGWDVAAKEAAWQRGPGGAEVPSDDQNGNEPDEPF